MLSTKGWIEADLDGGGTHREIVGWLAGGAGGAHPADKQIETHAARVFLIGARAFKIKKPIDLGYLDFSTLDKRRWALERELQRNRATTPQTYLGLREIRRRQDATLGFDGDGVVLDYALEMRRFDDDMLLRRHPELVCGELAEILGREVAGFHAGAAVLLDDTPSGGLAYSMATNRCRLRAFANLLGSEDVEALVTGTQAVFAAAADLLERRRRAGFVRRCHGDLHLGNIFLQDRRPVIFDCIEFDDRLSDIDVLYDLSFLIMDLLFHDQAQGANRVFNAYLDQALRSFDQALLSGLGLLPLFLSLRAAVRAHVSVQMDQVALGRAYLAAARDHLRPVVPQLIAVGGLSGTGKTTFARALAPSIGAAPGAVLLRSDEIRKRLWGVAPLERLPREAYTRRESTRVYRRLIDEARLALSAGCGVVLDAVFLREEERLSCESLARSLGVHFTGYWLEAPAEILRARLARRSGDASDADLGVLEGQLKRDPGEIDWKRVDVDSDPATLRSKP